MGGFGKAKCIFNGTFMNATIVDSTTIKCSYVKEFKLCALADELFSLQFFKLRNVLLIVTAQVGSKRKIIRRLAQALD